MYLEIARKSEQALEARLSRHLKDNAREEAAETRAMIGRI
jgi:hypothetical protein